MKNLRTNSKIVHDKVRKTILDAINVETEYLDECNKNIDPVIHVYNDFLRCTNYLNNLHRYPREQDRFKDWCMGIPGTFEVCYYTSGIIEIMENEWGLKQPENKNDIDSLDLYYYLIYSEFMKMYNKAKSI